MYAGQWHNYTNYLENVYVEWIRKTMSFDDQFYIRFHLIWNLRDDLVARPSFVQDEWAMEMKKKKRKKKQIENARMESAKADNDVTNVI